MPYSFQLLLKAGKHVICEKPLGMNLKETQEMVDLARKQKLFCMEAIWSRCLPAYEKVKELLEKGTNVSQYLINLHPGWQLI